MVQEPWQAGADSGADRAKQVEPSVLGRLLSRAERPLVVAGSEVDSEEDLPRYAADLAAALKAPLAVEPSRYPLFEELDVEPVPVSAMDLVELLTDPGWDGFGGEGSYDAVAFLGGLYYFQNLALSGLKHFSDVRTAALDGRYYPNATHSLGNLSEEDRAEAREEILDAAEETT